MKKLLFNCFNRTFGIIFRAIQMTLHDRSAPTGLLAQVHQIAVSESAEYAVSNFSEAMMFNRRQELWDYCLRRVPSLQLGGVILEFGVWKGESINFFAKKCPKALVYGFDSFEGLEEDWTGFEHHKGTFNTNGKLPKCERNVELYVGWFEETLPGFLATLKQSKISILHMDADTYKPTAYVLNSLSKNLCTGSVIIFDEFFGYPSFRSHEFKAFHEFINSTGTRYRFIGYTAMQVAIEIL
jgi:hypothetical protein